MTQQGRQDTDHLTFSTKTVERLHSAESVVVFTGAGISAESGVATFRDQETGVWSKFDPQDLASEPGFRRDPVLVQSWYQDRQRKLATVEPNLGHIAIAEIESMNSNFLLVTQNIDALHQRAGSKNVVELHGNLTSDHCIECRKQSGLSFSDATTLPLTCQLCGGLIRPGVVWFGEMLPDGAMERAAAAASRCDVLITVGTSGVVYPAAALPELAHANGAYTIEVNVEPSALHRVMDDSIIGPAGTTLPRLVEAVLERT